MLLWRNAECSEEKSYHYQIYHCLKVNHLFTKNYFRKKKTNYWYGFMPGNFQVICGSMVGKNCWSLASTETPVIFHFDWKSHFGVQSALYLCSQELRWNETENGIDFISVILAKIKFQTSMTFSCEQNSPKTKWISADLLDIAFNAHVYLKLIM